MIDIAIISASNSKESSSSLSTEPIKEHISSYVLFLTSLSSLANMSISFAISPFEYTK